MAKSDQLSKIAELVSDFERLDSSVSTAIGTGEPDLIDRILKAVDAKKKVKRYLADCKPLDVGRDLGIRLKKIRDNYGYTIDSVMEAIGRATGTPVSQESEEDKDYVGALFSEGTADYVDEDFFRRKNQIGTLVVSESLPDHFVQHFTNLRECYALGLFQAAVVYCRAVIETGCFEALRRKGRVKLDPQIEDIREFSLKALMRSVKPFVYEANWEKADATIKKADEILHSKRKRVAISEQGAFDAIQDTFAMVEELFSGGHTGARR